jgi:protein gp37
VSGPYWDTQWNPVQGCTPASEGCAHCWARSMHERFHAEPFSDVRTLPDRLSKPLHWRKPRVVFVCNTSDLFHEAVPFEFIAAVFGVMAACPQHTFLVLTKRPERMAEWFGQLASYAAGRGINRFADEPSSTHWIHYSCIEMAHNIRGWAGAKPHYDHRTPWPLPHVWLGTTVENQPRANERIPLLLQTPAAHRWVSAEPLLGGIDLDGIEALAGGAIDVRSALMCDVDPADDEGWNGATIDQVIVGGESGHRPCNVEWIRSLRDQCRCAYVPCYVKQLGSWVVGEHKLNPRHRSGADPSEWPEDLRVRELAWRKS